jgi:hypothetical protein
MRMASVTSRWLFETAHGEAGGDHQHRRFLRKLARLDPVGRLHRRERIRDDGRDAGALGDELVEARQQRTAARQYNLVDLFLRGRL